MDTDLFKTCPKCNQSLPRGAFSVARARPDGLCGYCRDCDNAMALHRRLAADATFAANEAARKLAFEERRPGEEWRDVAGYEGAYQVSSHGRVRSLPRNVSAPNRFGACIRSYRGRVLKQRSTEFGHKTVCLRRAGSGQPVLVHRLVCEAFHGPCPPDKQHCAHGDGNPENNRPENLRWATVRENAEDTRRHGNLRLGAKSNLANLTDAQVIEMRRLHAEEGVTGYRLTKLFGISLHCAYDVLNRKTWKHI